MNPNIIEQIIEQTCWMKGEPIEDLRGRLEKIGELVGPYYKVPPYKFEPATPMDRRVMLFGNPKEHSALNLLERARKWIRMIHERRDEVSPLWFRHGADPEPLLDDINKLLSE